jgi:uncharacterized membrane protein YqhA
MLRVYKIIISIILLLSFVNVLAMLALNILKAVHAYASLFTFGPHRPGLDLMELVDGLLMVLLLLIMTIGFLKLFLPDSRMSKAIDLPWLRVNSFTQLKMLLIETILTTLVVLFATHVVKSDGNLKWEDILIPISVFLLALTIKFVKDKEH